MGDAWQKVLKMRAERAAQGGGGPSKVPAANQYNGGPDTRPWHQGAKGVLLAGGDIKALAARASVPGKSSRDRSRSPPRKRPNPLARFITSEGEFEVELYLDRVPRYVSNFVDLVQKGFYNGLHFHRVEKNFMIQFGCPYSRQPHSAEAGSGGPSRGIFKNIATKENEMRAKGGKIKDEYTSKDSNLKGTLAMANCGQPNTGGSQFFVNMNDNTPLDWWTDGHNARHGPARHGVFGKVIKGYEVCEKIAAMEVQGKGNTTKHMPVKPIEMKRILLKGLDKDDVALKKSLTLQEKPYNADR